MIGFSFLSCPLTSFLPWKSAFKDIKKQVSHEIKKEFITDKSFLELTLIVFGSCEMKVDKLSIWTEPM